MAKDNIDLNAKSTMITSHYHGTSLSVNLSGNLGTTREHSFHDDTYHSKKLESLPKEYVYLRPLPRSSIGSEFFCYPVYN